MVYPERWGTTKAEDGETMLAMVMADAASGCSFMVRFGWWSSLVRCLISSALTTAMGGKWSFLLVNVTHIIPSIKII